MPCGSSQQIRFRLSSKERVTNPGAAASSSSGIDGRCSAGRNIREKPRRRAGDLDLSFVISCRGRRKAREQEIARAANWGTSDVRRGWYGAIAACLGTMVCRRRKWGSPGAGGVTLARRDRSSRTAGCTVPNCPACQCNGRPLAAA